jgi:ribosome-binding ATPase YchF (GTP1/OBG family)
MYWGDFTLGLVGKPSAGKSTFFNACKTIGTNAAKIGSFPFTTIEPNVGRATARFVWPDVIRTDPLPEDERGGGEVDREVDRVVDRVVDREVTDDDTGPGGEERTFSMEIFVKDVAGLVKGAYKGRGRGNRFLDDLCSADVLVHVLDGSGDTDDEGNSGTDMGRPSEDVEWVYAEV